MLHLIHVDYMLHLIHADYVLCAIRELCVTGNTIMWIVLQAMQVFNM